MKVTTFGKVALATTIATATPIETFAAGSPAPDMFVSQKTLAQFLNEGWEVKNGQLGVEIRGVVVFLTKGHDVTYCFVSDTTPKTNVKAVDGLFSSCVSTARQQ